MKIKFLILIAIIIIVSCFSVACNKTNEYEGVNVSVVSTNIENRAAPYEPEYTKWAIVEYTVENVGTKTINGWAVGFNVSFQNRPQLRTSHNVYYTIESGKISSTQTTSFQIPSNYYNATGAVLNYIETW